MTEQKNLKKYGKIIKKVAMKSLQRLEQRKCKLQNNKKLYNWKMDQLGDELDRAEKITKKLDEMQIDFDRVQSKTKEMEI